MILFFLSMEEESLVLLGGDFISVRKELQSYRKPMASHWSSRNSFAGRIAQWDKWDYFVMSISPHVVDLAIVQNVYLENCSKSWYADKIGQVRSNMEKLRKVWTAADSFEVIQLKLIRVPLLRCLLTTNEGRLDAFHILCSSWFSVKYEAVSNISTISFQADLSSSGSPRDISVRYCYVVQISP